MILVLGRTARQQTELQQFMQRLQNPNAPEYHQYLTPDQFGRRYGVSAADLATVTGWLRSQGFVVDRVLSGRMALEFSGDAAQVQSAFHTSIHSYLVNGELHYANASDPEIPAALAPIIAGITLSNFAPRPLSQSLGEAALDPLTHRPTPHFNDPISNTFGCLSGYCFAVVPGDLAAIYNTKPLLASGIDGAGVTIGVVGTSNIDLSVVGRFRQVFLPAYSATNLPNVIVDGPDPGTGTDSTTEAYLDVEMAGAMAPNATVNLYIAANTYVSGGVTLALARAVDENQAAVLSVSFGQCEAFLGAAKNQFFNNVYEQAAGQGITVLVSSGDSGSAGCDPPYNSSVSGPMQAVSGLFVSGLASTPYNVAVGGTDFYYPANATQATLSTYWNTSTAANPNNNADWSSAKAYIPEKPWNMSDPALNQVNMSGVGSGAGGGGASSCLDYFGRVDSGSTADKAMCQGAYAKPEWQSGFGIDTVRDLPDVSLFASDGSNYSFVAVCVSTSDCAVPNGGPNSSTAPLKVFALGGTSASAPAMAGMMALVVDKTQSRQGQANTVLYPLSQQQPQAFHDIAVGTIRIGCKAGSPDCGADGFLTGYNATTGYDLATGLGSVDAAVLVNSWSSISFNPTATSLTIAPTTAIHGTPLSFTVNVTGGPTSGDITLLTTQASGSPTGLYTGACAAFPCTFGYAALPGGNYSVSARYSGSSKYAPSTSAAVPVTITPENSEVAIYYVVGQTSTGQVSNLNGQTLLYGTRVIITAIPVPENYSLPLNASDIASTPATGNIVVTDAGVAVGAPLPLNSAGQAVFSSSTFAVGNHSLVAHYAGDSSYKPSDTVSPVRTPMNFTVGATNTTLKLDPFYQEVLPGGTGSVTAYIATMGTAAPTGTVTFSVTSSAGTVALPAVAITSTSGRNAVAAITIPASALVAGPQTVSQTGNNSVTATYSGDTNYLPATQQTAAQIYDAQVSTNVFLSIAPNAPTAGQSAVITARVGWSNLLSIPGFPAGSVDFLDGTSPLGTVSITPDAYGNGIATFSTSGLTAGVHTLTANYKGNTQFLSSTASITVTIASVPPPAFVFNLSATPVTIPKGAGNPSEASTLSFVLNQALSSASQISLSCAVGSKAIPMSCKVPASVSVATGVTKASSTVTISIAGVMARMEPNKQIGYPQWLMAAGSIAFALLLPWGLGRRRRAWRTYVCVLSSLAFAVGLSSCGVVSLRFQTVPQGTYGVTATATVGSVTHQINIPVTVQ